MTFNDIDEFKRIGFTGFKSIRELYQDSSMIPDNGGVYLVLNINNRKGDFISAGSGGFFKEKDPNVSIEELMKNWVEDAKVLYIGKATSLRSRLRQYLRFGQGADVGHYGGRYIWQLSYVKDLVICWKTLPNNDPREFEANMIKLFVENFGKRPFANLAN